MDRKLDYMKEPEWSVNCVLASIPQDHLPVAIAAWKKMRRKTVEVYCNGRRILVKRNIIVEMAEKHIEGDC